MQADTYVVWFRNDFRFDDNPALKKALDAAEQTNGEILFVFHLHPDFTGQIDLSNDYFFQTVDNFSRQCEEAGMKLHIISGSVTEAFQQLFDQLSGIHTIFGAVEYTSFAAARDEEARSVIEKNGAYFEQTPGNYIHPPEDILKEDGSPYKVYTPYSRNWMQAEKPSLSSVTQKDLKSSYGTKETLDAESEKAWEKVVELCECTWQRLGEKEGRKRLEHFCKKVLPHYDESRDLPEKAGTSRLSPYLRTGSLSARRVFQAADSAREKQAAKGPETFIKELAWRDFYNMIFHQFPEVETKEFQEKYRELSWREDEDLLQKWKEGRTGFPIVDAGMRQLNKVGWMHNRLRMITASFLTKDYQMDWRIGEAYFREKLIDHDPASNSGGWQWSSSVGTDAAPYFRVFSPVRQGARFDPEGAFVKKYVPELKEVPVKFIHEPHKMKKEEQERAGCIIGKDYPEPSVDHKEERKRAIAMFKDLDTE
ncbi:cryptochrome/photolyase family protein [Alkalicoccus daliensis]|uniref:Deoxyribodipyrimidine photo-lyase n=1 Tax=Alkalicoccus daliensis TaxID=745820 RepID=A0A1G9ZB86_9BACI|nr:deoxyribodipyrimidine photo-lyase [Alkalicoccus daliensis]SDN18385.1 deoxyribodipyrimidine photo-lyase [Alkalicoccus daliensis]